MNELERKILDAIAERQLAPRPAYVFLAKRSVFWALAAVSIALGALSVAISMFAVSDFLSTGGRVLDNIHLNEALLAVPLLWLALTSAFVASAVYGLRQTRRGYRFRASHVAAGVVAISLVFGALLYASNIGNAVHEYLEENFQAYRDFVYVPFAEWSRPDAGFLGGTVMADDGGGTIELLDFHDKTWTVDVSGADIDLDSSLIDEGDIAIEGERTGDDTFRARKIGEFD
jgi:hypothetical protein